MISKRLLYIFILVIGFADAQTFSGKVLDASTNAPIESVSVYFDNTTIGTTTNDKGEFSIDFTASVQSTLVISYLGYEKVFIADYRSKNDITILLKEATNQLDAVVIDADDGMPRAQKLKWFRKEFLGRSENGESCKILNEKDLRFRYNKRTRTLMAWSNAPIVVKNKNLKYLISLDIIDFELVLGNWNASSVIYSVTSFYEDLNTSHKKRIIKNREDAYSGSVQHFMRALYSKQFKEEGYVFGVRGFVVNPYEHFTIFNTDNLGYKTVSLKKKLDIFYKDDSESVIQTNVSEFKVDKYGNYEPIPNVLFGGAMGSQRIGDSLPLDYGLEN